MQPAKCLLATERWNPGVRTGSKKTGHIIEMKQHDSTPLVASTDHKALLLTKTQNSKYVSTSLQNVHSVSKSYRGVKQTWPSRIVPGNGSVIWIQSLLASPNSITSELSNRILQNWKFWFHSHPGSLTNIAMLRQVRSSNWQLTAELSRKATWWTQTDRKQRYSEMEKLKVKKQHGKPMRRQVACLQSERVCWWTLQTKCIPFFEDWQTGAVSCHKLLLKLPSYRIQLNWWQDLTDFPIDTKM